MRRSSRHDQRDKWIVSYVLPVVFNECLGISLSLIFTSILTISQTIRAIISLLKLLSLSVSLFSSENVNEKDKTGEALKARKNLHINDFCADQSASACKFMSALFPRQRGGESQP